MASRSPGFSIRMPASALVDQLGISVLADTAMMVAANRFESEWKQILKLASPQGQTYGTDVTFITTSGSPRRVIPVGRSAGQLSRSSPHVASAPGDPPATDTGQLSNAPTTDRRGFADYAVGMGGQVGRIGLALEFGINVPGSEVARHPAVNFEVEARPHGRPALDEALPGMRGDVLAIMRGRA